MIVELILDTQFGNGLYRAGDEVNLAHILAKRMIAEGKAKPQKGTKARKELDAAGAKARKKAEKQAKAEADPKGTEDSKGPE